MGVFFLYGLYNIIGLVCGLRILIIIKEIFCLEVMLWERIDLYVDLCIYLLKCCLL